MIKNGKSLLDFSCLVISLPCKHYFSVAIIEEVNRPIQHHVQKSIQQYLLFNQQKLREATHSRCRCTDVTCLVLSVKILLPDKVSFRFLVLPSFPWRPFLLFSFSAQRDTTNIELQWPSDRDIHQFTSIHLAKEFTQKTRNDYQALSHKVRLIIFTSIIF